MSEPAVDRIVAFFESFSVADLERLDAWYAPAATFKDPFNDVRGLAAIRQVYSHMFETLDGPRFRVTECIGGGPHCVLLWEFRFRSRSRGAREWLVVGASHLVLGEDGRIAVHRDYWDPAEEVYGKVPVLGAVVRWLRRRLAAPQGRG